MKRKSRMLEIDGFVIHQKVCNDFYNSKYRKINDFVLDKLGMNYYAYNRIIKNNGTLKKEHLLALKKYM